MTAPSRPADRLVAVVGMGIRVPKAADVAAFWRVLNGQQDVFSEPGGRFALSHFWSADPQAPDRTYARRAGYIHDFRPHPVLRRGEACQGGPGRDHAVRWLRDAVLQARDGVHRVSTDRCGVYVGAWPGGSQSLLESLVVDITCRALAGRVDLDEIRDVLLDHYRHAVPLPEAALPDAIVRTAVDGLEEKVTESIVVDTACASSLYAVDLGTKALLAGDCEVAYCGGVTVGDPTMAVMFAKLHGLSPQGRVRAFDAGADGTVFSDGAGIVTLKTLERARADNDTVFGVLAGFGGAADGRGKSISAPNPGGQERAITRARAVNGLSPEQVDWVVAHGTGTPAGDGVESRVLTAMGPPDGTLYSSNKPIFGHTGWSAGVVSLIHALMAMRHQWIPAQLGASPAGFPVSHGQAPGTRASGVCVPDRPIRFPRRPERPRIAGVSAFGFGGTNAHLIVCDQPPGAEMPLTPTCRPGTVPASAPALATDEAMVLVGWSTLLPGEPSPEQVSMWLRGTGPTIAPAFPVPYPLPSPADVRLATSTIQAVDRCQLMALQVAARFVETHGELWAQSHETTGVIAAHMGPPRGLVGTALRCYASDVVSTLAANVTGLSSAEMSHRLKPVLRGFRPATEDTQAGVLPNVIASRIAARYDLHGPTMAVDAGRDGSLTALRVAQRYLLTGELDLALLLAVNGNSTPEMAVLAGADEDGLAEGAFLLAVTRPDVAENRGWPALARLSFDTTSHQDKGRTDTATRPAVRPHSYLAADQAVTIMRAVETGRPTTVWPDGGQTRPLVVTPVADATAHERHTSPGRPSVKMTSRYTREWTVAPRAAGMRDRQETLPWRGVVLADSARTAEQLVPGLADAKAALVSIDPHGVPTGLGLDDLEAPGTRNRLEEIFDEASPSLTVVADLSALSHDQALRLHDALFVLTQALLPRWQPSSSLAIVLASTDERGPHPPQAALFSGFVKSLRWEHPQAAALVITSDESISPRLLGQAMTERSSRPVPPALVCFTQGLRRVETLHPRPVPAVTPPMPVGDDSVVLVTGGVGGIPQALLLALAEHARPKLWLLGRTPEAPAQADLLSVADDQLPAVRVALLREARREHPDRSVRSLVRHVQAQLKAREVHLAVRRLTQRYGSDKVAYLSCDIRDRAQVAAAVDTVLGADGRVDLLVHAAGMVRSALLQHKDLETFRAVRDTKVRGYHHLKAALAASPPRVWCNIGSYSGTAGAPGDTDYAAANAYLEAAAELPAPTTEITVSFTMWHQTGMGADPLFQEQVMRDAQFTPITTEEGTAQFLAEVNAAHLLGGTARFLGARERERLGVHNPLVVSDRPPDPDSHHEKPRWTASRSKGTLPASSASWTYLPDETVDRYLFDHLVDGKPTMPATFVLELAAQAAEELVPSLSTVGFRDVQFLTFIRPFNQRASRALHIQARISDRSPGTAATRVAVAVASDILGPDGRIRPGALAHFHGEVLLSDRPSPAPSWPAPALESTDPASDPYADPQARVSLRGVFRNLSQCRVGDGVAFGRWTPHLAGARHLRAMTTPALLTCAALRTCALRPGDRQGTRLPVPRFIQRLDLYNHRANDRDLVARHGHALQVFKTADTYRACTSDGHVLLEASGVGLADLTGPTR